MSGPDRHDVDWHEMDWHDLDQLADYIAGELTGEEAGRVAHLVATDARWAAVHRALQGAEPVVRATLRSAGAQAEVLPADVADRLTAADRTTTPHPVTAADGMATPARLAAPGRSDPGPALPVRTLWRRRRVLVVAAAAAVLACGAGSVATLGPLLTRQADRSTSAEAPDNGAPLFTVATAPVPSGASGAPVALFATGTDYHRDTLVRAADLAGDLTLHDRVESAPLANEESFDACLSAVRELHPGEVRLADFAHYDGDPAVIMKIEQETGSIVIAVSAECGRDGDAHELAAVVLP